jgi:hypothetical protein
MMKSTAKLWLCIAMTAIALGAAACGSDDGDIRQWGDWVETIAPTCTTEGEETRTCAFDSTVTETRPLAIRHAWGDWEETIEPTCVAAGEETNTCSRDGCSEIDTRPVAADPDAHNFKWTITTAPTETDNGEETLQCSECSADTETRTAYATGTAGLSLLYMGGLYHVSGGTVTSGVVHIPRYYRGAEYVPYVPVTTIVADAFRGISGLTSVTIPDSVTTIGDFAFHGCTGLTSATIGTGVTTIGHGAFEDTGLTSVTVLATTPPTLGGGAFAVIASAAADLQIFVPAGSIALYRVAPWTWYVDNPDEKIVAMP